MLQASIRHKQILFHYDCYHSKFKLIEYHRKTGRNTLRAMKNSDIFLEFCFKKQVQPSLLFVCFNKFPWEHELPNHERTSVDHGRLPWHPLRSPGSTRGCRHTVILLIFPKALFTSSYQTKKLLTWTTVINLHTTTIDNLSFLFHIRPKPKHPSSSDLLSIKMRITTEPCKATREHCKYNNKLYQTIIQS